MDKTQGLNKISTKYKNDDDDSDFWALNMLPTKRYTTLPSRQCVIPVVAPPSLAVHC